MNREQAIAIIRKEYLCVDRDCDIDRSCGKCDLMIPSKEPILEAYKMAIKALEQEPKYCDRNICIKNEYNGISCDECEVTKSQEPKTDWIPVSERLPENLQTVNVTWQNHEPEPYYHDIKDRSFVATAVYYNEDWYWYSTTCADYLGEYGSNEIDKVDDAVEIIAWMPLPKPYEPQESEEV